MLMQGITMQQQQQQQQQQHLVANNNLVVGGAFGAGMMGSQTHPSPQQPQSQMGLHIPPGYAGGNGNLINATFNNIQQTLQNVNNNNNTNNNINTNNVSFNMNNAIPQKIFVSEQERSYVVSLL
jgi:hypothetical protein